MRLFVGSLVLAVSFSAAAGPVIDCRKHGVDEAKHVTVEREVVNMGTPKAAFKTSITVKTINLNTDVVEKSVTESATETVEEQMKAVFSKNYVLDLPVVGRTIVTNDGTRITSTEGVLTEFLRNGRTVETTMNCDSFDRW